MSKKKSDGSNSPFAALGRPPAAEMATQEAAVKADAAKRAAAKAEAERAEAAARSARVAAATAPFGDVPDDQLFDEAMSGVRRLDRSAARAPRNVSPDSIRARAAATSPGGPDAAAAGPSRRTRDDAEADAALADLVAQPGNFDLTDAGDHVDGLAPGCDRRLLRKLKHGDYVPEGRLDLHGHDAASARREVERFVTQARRGGKRCILIIHGRGNQSAGGAPVLKPALPEWLSSGALSRAVLAFTGAAPDAGGAGATMVLLRRS